MHAYERSQPVYNYTVSDCGIVYLTVGDGGNIEGADSAFVDTPGNCPQMDGFKKDQPQKCVYLQPNGAYCPSSQPLWSAFREPSFGYGTLEVINSTNALWQWHSNEVCFRGEILVGSTLLYHATRFPGAKCCCFG